jgi:copper chaperone CopZ
MTEKKINIEGMSCMHCVKAVEVELEELGVEFYDVKIGSADVKYDETKISENDLIKAVDEAGYKVV